MVLLEEEVPGEDEMMTLAPLGTGSASRSRASAMPTAVPAGTAGSVGRERLSANGRAGGLSLAVLPMRNVSSDPENEYFSDGLTDELISSLGTLPGLRVVSRTSAFSFKGSTRTIREIGEALNVNVILEGSVRHSGARVRVTTQLIDVRQGFTLWSSRFDREVSDVFELQDELASSVVSALREKLAPHLHLSDLQARTPMQSEAYEEYLKGRYHWNRKTVEDVQLARADILFNQVGVVIADLG